MSGLVLGEEREGSLPLRGDEGEQVGGGSKPRALLPEVVGGDQIQVLFRQLLPGIFKEVAGLHREAAQELSGTAAPSAGQSA